MFPFDSAKIGTFPVETYPRNVIEKLRTAGFINLSLYLTPVKFEPTSNPTE